MRRFSGTRLAPPSARCGQKASCRLRAPARLGRSGKHPRVAVVVSTTEPSGQAVGTTASKPAAASTRNQLEQRIHTRIPMAFGYRRDHRLAAFILGEALLDFGERGFRSFEIGLV